MTHKLKKGDYVSVDYTGKVGDAFFDTTQEEIAKKIGIFNSNTKYGPVTIRVGEGHILKGLDESLEDKDCDSKFSISLTPEKAFGKKDAKLIKLVPRSAFTRHNVNPQVGLQVTIDNGTATIRSIAGGRILVDYNHPLAGKTVHYDVQIHKILTDPKKQMQTVLSREFQISENVYKVKFTGSNATLMFSTGPIPEPLAKVINDRIIVCVPSIKKVECTFEKSKGNDTSQEIEKSE